MSPEAVNATVRMMNAGKISPILVPHAWDLYTFLIRQTRHTIELEELNFIWVSRFCLFKTFGIAWTTA